jgi:hypothetical protein
MDNISVEKKWMFINKTVFGTEYQMVFDRTVKWSLTVLSNGL